MNKTSLFETSVRFNLEKELKKHIYSKCKNNKNILLNSNLYIIKNGDLMNFN